MGRRWTAAEDRVLRAGYADGTSLRAIAEQLGRTPDSVSERRRTLRIPARPRQRPWSAAESRLLHAGSAVGLPASVIAEQLGRPDEQVRRRRRALIGSGMAGRPYTPDDDARIAACWSAGGDVDALARTLSRPAGSVRLRALKLGLHRPAARPRWTAREDAALRDGYEHGLTCAQIVAELPRRTTTAAAARAAKLGLATYARAWTRREEERLRQLSSTGADVTAAAQLLGRTPEALRARARKLGIEPPRLVHASRAGRRWTAHEDERLRLHAALNPAALATLLERTPEAITQRLRRLGLRRGAERSPHHPVAARGRLTPGERAVLARELKTAGARRRLVVARRLGVSPAAIGSPGER